MAKCAWDIRYILLLAVVPFIYIQVRVQITQIHSLLLDFGTLFSNALLFSWNFPRLRCGFSQRSPNMLIVLLLLYVCFISISSFSSFISFLFLLFNNFNFSNSLIGWWSHRSKQKTTARVRRDYSLIRLACNKEESWPLKVHVIGTSFFCLFVLLIWNFHCSFSNWKLPSDCFCQNHLKYILRSKW